jgi:hypothetical protein
MRKIAFLSIIALSMVCGRANAAPAVVLGTNNQDVQGTYVCKGQGHQQNGAPAGLYIVLKVDNGGNVTGGELGEPLNSTFCTFSILTSSSVTVDSQEVGHLSLNLKPMSVPSNSNGPGSPLLGLLGGGCKAVTETFEFAGLNHGGTRLEFTETDSGVEAGGTCEMVSLAF